MPKQKPAPEKTLSVLVYTDDGEKHCFPNVSTLAQLGNFLSVKTCGEENHFNLRNVRRYRAITNDQDLVALVRSFGDQYIRAIKAVRQAAGMTLKDAKAFVDKVRA